MTDYMIAEIYSRAQQEMLVADCANYGVLGTIAPFLTFYFIQHKQTKHCIINWTISHLVQIHALLT